MRPGGSVRLSTPLRKSLWPRCCDGHARRRLPCAPFVVWRSSQPLGPGPTAKLVLKLRQPVTDFNMTMVASREYLTRASTRFLDREGHAPLVYPNL